MTVVFVLAAAALMLVAAPAGFWMLLIAAGIAGVAQSFPNGVTNRILLERVPISKRIGWVGIKQLGVQVSQLTASLAFPLLAAVAGWRGAALLVALVPSPSDGAVVAIAAHRTAAHGCSLAIR